ncbi:hypothetical protein EKD00_03260 [Chlorobium phaeovibrioides]|uniref:nucleotidyl transferase AbiEii/AbiGii toxin family protein n=1 Tax=Chlorobium phaeovibrioides TaxID=1094 RepID=UPI000F8247B8|nr:nucleotidyl transferase AbiEii/AbiGii toxin family protein [Chlorobium phaeovibrioides]RTY36765.1 hypothetical protein EKD00_03260 [Chlorobium phaeovibrioides]
MLPTSCYVKCFSLPDLFAGKMHTLLFSNRKTRVSGRDWFDFEWFVRHSIPLSLSHFVVRANQSGHLIEAIQMLGAGALIAGQTTAPRMQ